MSKTIQDYIDKHPDKFVSWWNEDHNERGLDYWVECKHPYFDPMTEVMCIHEDTVKETLVAMRRVVKGRHNGYSWEAINKDATCNQTEHEKQSCERFKFHVNGCNFCKNKR